MKQGKAWKLLAKLRQERIRELRAEMLQREARWLNEIGELNAEIATHESDIEGLREQLAQRTHELKDAWALLSEANLTIKRLEQKVEDCRQATRAEHTNHETP
jgi:chromosome segregation ATPase